MTQQSSCTSRVVRHSAACVMLTRDSFYRSSSPPAATQHSGDGGGLRDLPERLPQAQPLAADDDFEFDWRAEVHSLAASLRWAVSKHLIASPHAHSYKSACRAIHETKQAAQGLCASAGRAQTVQLQMQKRTRFWDQNACI